MGLLSAILGLPFAPIRGVLSLGELIQRQVEQELHDPSTARRELERIEEAAAAGEISPEQQAEAEQRVVERMIGPGAGGVGPPAPGAGQR